MSYLLISTGTYISFSYKWFQTWERCTNSTTHGCTLKVVPICKLSLWFKLQHIINTEHREINEEHNEASSSVWKAGL